MKGAFLTIYEEARKIKFKKEWENGTGYFDHLDKENIRDIVGFEDDHGRKVVVLPFDNKIIVMNERFSKRDIIVSCVYFRVM